eukprot:192868_1
MSLSLYMLSLTVMFQLLTSHPKTHKCLHDKIDFTIHQQYVKYKNDPFNKTSNNHRNLLQDPQTYQPIRIRPYYDPLSINESILTINQISYIKSLMSASIHHLQSFIKVVPIDGPLFVDRCPESSAKTAIHKEFVFPSCSETKLSILSPKSCGQAMIPEEHLAESWSSNIVGFSKLFAPGGTGIKNTDLIIYVTYSNEYCSNQTLAYALPCSVDQIGRPIAGSINFCSSVLSDENYWKFDVMVTLHELTHILIFTPTLWDKFYDVNRRTIIPYEQVVLNHNNASWIVTPNVQQIAREHYNCNTLPGVPLENWGLEGTINSHWEAKYMQYEYMNGMILAAQLYVSKFTLGFMHDSGWYDIDYNYAEKFTWGHNEGCDFFIQRCIDNNTKTSNYPQYFCESNLDNGCSFDYASIAHCLLYNYSIEGIPNEFKYYTDSDLGGTEMHDYCGLRNPWDYEYNNNYTDFEPICWDERGNTLHPVLYSSSYFGIDSRCVDTINVNDTKSGYCFKHQCIDYNDINKSYAAVNIQLNTSDIITCYRNQSLMDIYVSYSSLKSIKCPNIDAVCGESWKPFECYWGYYNDELEECICSVGFIGNKCDIPDINYIVTEAEIMETRSPTRAISNRFCVFWAPYNHFTFQGEYEYDRIYEGYPSYIHYVNVNVSTYLYFSRADSRWQLTKEKNSWDHSNYDYIGYCEQYGIEGKANIETCANWYFFDGMGFVKERIVYDGNCSKWINPYLLTLVPSLSRTEMPSVYPTLYPVLQTENTVVSVSEVTVNIANIENVFITKFMFILLMCMILF